MTGTSGSSSSVYSSSLYIRDARFCWLFPRDRGKGGGDGQLPKELLHITRNKVNAKPSAIKIEQVQKGSWTA